MSANAQLTSEPVQTTPNTPIGGGPHGGESTPHGTEKHIKGPQQSKRDHGVRQKFLS